MIQLTWDALPFFCFLLFFSVLMRRMTDAYAILMQMEPQLLDFQFTWLVSFTLTILSCSQELAMFSSLHCWDVERDQRTQWEMGGSWKWERILVFPWEPMIAVTSGTLESGQGLWDKKVNCVSNRPAPQNPDVWSNANLSIAREVFFR